MQKLKKNDEVVVIAGKDKGKTGKVLNVNLKTRKVMVQGINIVKKTIKPTQENPTGGIVDKEAAIHISNIALISPKTKKATRVRIEKKDGKNIRVAAKCGSVIE
ncbi:MAG: 50S ribosomal protein L24 [Bacteriovoracaceae bacterium]|nr:50S ribosomal protein L24 [Bacteriovoracaceae bacterium]